MLELLNIKQNDMVNIETSSGNIQLEVKVDNQLDGNIAYVPTFDKKIDTKALFESYRFTNANIKKV
jgi:NADH-quinone oxidoreductase subunit G